MNNKYDSARYQKQKEQRARKKQDHALAARELKQYLIDKDLWNDIPMVCQLFLEETSVLSKQFVNANMLKLLFGSLVPGSSVSLKHAMLKMHKGPSAVKEFMNSQSIKIEYNKYDETFVIAGYERT